MLVQHDVGAGLTGAAPGTIEKNLFQEYSMRHLTRTSALVAAMVLTAATAQAQGAAGAAGRAAGQERRAAAQERRADARENLGQKLKDMTPEERKAALAQAKERREERREERLENATPEQRAWAQAMAAEGKRIQEGVKAGTLTRETAAAQLKAWREANPRPKGNGGF
ncbi:hypothetical protein [Gemmatimonas phototrophica]|uniref:Uncharacterized protein n=1 Tax=Gemmatimonas phototrophica TaxID=1379270 RepID=A0A143BL05_9BACT|nr:hypothetical protein [Gemmatimonas phototrophica]AMW05717.1 hypothetical protein GEMMAAP_14775 [Gemmatimonas phototrophica]